MGKVVKVTQAFAGRKEPLPWHSRGRKEQLPRRSQEGRNSYPGVAGKEGIVFLFVLTYA